MCNASTQRRTPAGAWVMALLLLAAGPAGAASISFNNFVFDAGAPVVITLDGSSATLTESASLGVVFLSNVPGLGDPELIIAAPGYMLTFDYQFDEPAGNDDVFHVALLDGTNGDPLGGAFEFFASGSSSGQVQFDLSSLVGLTLGLQFELAAEFGDAVLTSSLTLSNLQTTPVPAPAAAPLLLTALAWAIRWRRRRGLPA